MGGVIVKSKLKKLKKLFLLFKLSINDFFIMVMVIMVVVTAAGITCCSSSTLLSRSILINLGADFLHDFVQGVNLLGNLIGGAGSVGFFQLFDFAINLFLGVGINFVTKFFQHFFGLEEHGLGIIVRIDVSFSLGIFRFVLLSFFFHPFNLILAQLPRAGYLNALFLSCS